MFWVILGLVCILVGLFVGWLVGFSFFCFCFITRVVGLMVVWCFVCVVIVVFSIEVFSYYIVGWFGVVFVGCGLVCGCRWVGLLV